MAQPTKAQLTAGLAAYLAARLPDARGLSVEGLERISGGASRETYRFRLLTPGAPPRPLILRRDPPASLIDTDRRTEFEAYRAFEGSDVPVPRMLFLEETDTHLGAPFFIAEEICGFQAAPALLVSGAYDAVLPALAKAKWTILGRIAAADPQALGLTAHMPVPALDACWRRELDHWEGLIDRDAPLHLGEPLPVTRAAIRWLRANPPPPARKLSVVHGDYRTGNFLFDEQGQIHGVLDWEMAHLGDPLEDLGWSLQPVWSFGKVGPGGEPLAGGLAPRNVAIAAWEAASGMTADPAALHWWTLFNCVKGQGIWVGSAAAFTSGGNRSPIMIYPAWWLVNAQERAMLKLMGRL